MSVYTEYVCISLYIMYIEQKLICYIDKVILLPYRYNILLFMKQNVHRQYDHQRRNRKMLINRLDH